MTFDREKLAAASVELNELDDKLVDLSMALMTAGETVKTLLASVIEVRDEADVAIQSLQRLAKLQNTKA